MSHSPRIRTVLSCTLLVVAVGTVTTACGAGGHPLSAKPYDAAGQIAFNGPAGSSGKADPDKPLEVTAQGDDGRITDVTATDEQGRYVAGELSADGTRWHSTVPLAAGAHYTVRVSTEDDEGSPGRKVLALDTAAAAKKSRLKVTFGPEAGKYGVGQPVTAKLSAPVKAKAARAVVERALKVRSQPATEGSWHWVDSRTLHYRPKEFWPTHATIEAHSNLEGVKVTDKLWGAGSKPLKLTTGDKVVAVTDAASHWMTVYRNGEEINSIPVTTGKPGYSTRNGIKVVLGKEYAVRMTSASIGASDFYDKMVYYATRVTDSGEYIHAAPWSVDSQGYANTSHGCTGMSTGNAAWFYETVRQGDIVEVVNSYGADMDHFGNGYGDWNVPWKSWRKGSALLADTKAGRAALAATRLRPQSA
ncbi:Putative L,D-transpeptidase LppS precursor [Streptomyces sp. YIM 121038]|uniref:L,D-transpeptidase n=1 Tax=Streptomyces sp. YIM 121038 TaxID=2136401 RepID=UPI001110CF67|nr:Ig-like domain-containing protein [Streptomyces sp. YIM 121038]QCX76094.1 Putative L,D-transpeptidase LppS precursor [Streptomyces sp. YIM 121038]